MVRDVSSRFGCRQSDTFHQHRQLRRRQEHFAIAGRRPGEAATLQPFGQQAQSVAGGPQQFDLTAAAAPEDEDVAGHRVIFQRCLHLCGETIEAVAHIGDTGNQPDFCACGKIYHTDPRISSAQDSAHKLN